MGEQYKLRLGDGTVVAVDYDGLRSWMLDQKAMVQPPGSRRWRPLRQLLAEEPVAPVRAIEPTVTPAPPAPPPPIVVEPPRAQAPPPPVAAAPIVAPPVLARPVVAPPPTVAPPPPPPPVVARPVVPPAPPAPAPIAPPPAAPPRVASPVAAATVARAPAPPPSAPPVAQPRQMVAPSPLLLSSIDEPADEDDDAPFHVGDDEPAFHVAEAPEAPSLLDVAVAEVERHGGGDGVWEWRPADRMVVESTMTPHEPPPPRIVPVSEEVLEDIELAMDEDDRLEPRAVAPRAARSNAGPVAAAVALPPAIENALRRVAQWVDRLLARVRATRTAGGQAEWGMVAATAAPREVLQPPPPLSALPILKLAPIAEDVTARDPNSSPSPFRPRPWMWRGLAALGLLVVVIAAVLTRGAWMPAAGTRVSGDKASSLPPAPPAVPEPPPLPPEVRAAIAQLPHLSSDTIQLVMAKRARGRPDPPEVFRQAHDAALRGVPDLPEDDARELRAASSAVLASLSRVDRDRVRAYDRMSPERDLLVGEDAKVMALYARGVRGIGAERRQRLQELLGRAIAAELNRQPTP